MNNNTKVFFETFKGNPVIGIWKIDVLGNKTGRAPVVSFGIKKAQAILNHLDEIQTWLSELEERNNATGADGAAGAAGALDLSQLSPSQLDTFKALLAQAAK